MGVAPNKVLAKVASKRNKPDGFAYIEHCDIDEYLRELPTDKLWGIGPRLSARLSALGVRTALQFKNKPLSWVSEYFERPGQDIWRELNGEKVFPLNLEPKTSYDSIQKFKTFTPATSDKNYLFSQLCKNIENACIKARRHKLIARKVAFVLRTREFRHRSHEEKLALPTAGPEFLCSRARENFERFWRRGERYRATGVVLGDLVPAATRPCDLFGESRALEKFERLHKTVDDIDARFGKHTVHLLSSLSAIRDGTVRGGKRVAAYRSEVPLSGETARRHIALPLLGKVW